MKKILPIIYCFFLVTACSKNTKTVDDKLLPMIVLTSPSNGQIFTPGATVNITADITDNIKLAEIHVHIFNYATGQLLIDIHRYPNAAAYTLNESFQVQSGINYKIQVIAIDNSGNSETQTILVMVS